MFNHFSKKRKNMVECKEEEFKPPLQVSNQGLKENIITLVRRFLDLQFGSIWRDLSETLPHVSGSVLDIGCGAQPFRTMFSAKTNYIGIDTIESQPNFGYVHRSNTLYFSGKTLPAQNESADFILCTETLEHILEPNWLLDEMWRCLKQGGYMLLTVPFAARWHFIPFDYWRYTPSSLFYLLDKSGFKNIKVYARGNSFVVVCQKLIGIILPFLFSQSKSKLMTMINRVIGMLLFPLIFLIAAVGNIAMNRTKGAEDCLGFTVLVEK